ncbi:MAG: sialate O-acetylesterase [Povalibacter sp.]
MNNERIRSLSRIAFVLMLSSTQSWADAPSLLHQLFQDHAVLQRDKPIAVWGDAAAGENVTITLAGQTAVATADSQGHWSANLPAMTAGGPYTLEARAGGKQQVANDVLIGDVFLCSGQSNMGMQVSYAANAYSEILNADNKSIRMLTVHQDISITPLREFVQPVSWELTTPETVRNFSAACYFFARELQKSVKVPLGLIHSSWGGSKIEAWMSDAALRSAGAEDQKLDILKTFATDPAKGGAQWGELWESWWHAQTQTHGTPDPWSIRTDNSRWRDVPAGMQAWEKWGVPELESYDGIVWYRTTLTLTPQQAKQRAQLSIGPVDQVDQTWFNGRPIGNTIGYKDSKPTDLFQQNRQKLGRSSVYYLDAGSLKAGDNVVVVSVLDTWGFGGLYGPEEQRQLLLADGTTISLKDGWRYQIAPAGLTSVPRAPWEAVAGLTTIRNAMIAPLGAYGLRGVAWYQGESNTEQPERYLALAQAWMKDWRAQFGSDLPFLLVQLPNYGDLPTEPTESGWAGVREAQRLATVKDAHAGLAVAIDIGDPYDLHPANKQEVGRRLAVAARHVIYGEKTPASGATPTSARRQGDAVVVTFTDVTEKLVTYSAEHPIGFELCSADAKSCRYADATLQQNQIVLTAKEVPAPTRVRYCWADSPVCTLYDESKLPAGPFQLEVSP